MSSSPEVPTTSPSPAPPTPGLAEPLAAATPPAQAAAAAVGAVAAATAFTPAPFVMQAVAETATTTPAASPPAFSFESSFSSFTIGSSKSPNPSRTQTNPTSPPPSFTSSPSSSTPSFTAPSFSFSVPASFDVATPVPLVTAPSGGVVVNNPFLPQSSKPFEKPTDRTKEEGNKKEVVVGEKKAAALPPTPTPAPAAVESTPPPFPPPPARIDPTRQYAPIPVVEQKILDLLSLACEDTFRNPEFDEILARIKHHFYHREFEAVFGSEEHLPVYMAQYLPMRALCYQHLWSSNPLLQKLLEKDLTIYSIGAGPGSEAVGITIAREVSIRRRVREGKLSMEQLAHPSTPPKFRIHTQDLFDWTSSLAPLLSSMSYHAPLAYANTHYTFSTSNILDKNIKTAQFKNSHIITMMYVINELFQENKAATVEFLDRLITAMRPGAFLMVVDSAGDFSHVAIGAGEDHTERRGLQKKNNRGEGEEEEEEEEEEGEKEKTAAGASSTPSVPPKVRRKYFVYHLLDAIPSLRALVKEDSVWYRYPGQELKLKYPLKFENCRYFLRVYQKKA